jgi:hypothetical protein
MPLPTLDAIRRFGDSSEAGVSMTSSSKTDKFVRGRDHSWPGS